MSVMRRLASSLGQRNDKPNQELAAELAESKNKRDIQELAAHLADGDPNIQSDCIKTLYEIGYIAPELIAPYVDQFLDLLSSKNNRLVWGGMIALSTIAGQQPAPIYRRLGLVMDTIAKGSVITEDAGISVLAQVAAANAAYGKRIVPHLLERLGACRPKSVAQYAERCVVAVNARNREQFIEVLQKRFDDLTPSQQARVKRLIRKLETLS